MLKVCPPKVTYPPFLAHPGQEQRGQIFQDYVKVGGCLDQLKVKFESQLAEKQGSNIVWGFRPEKWLQDRHGERKAKKLIDRKVSQGLWFGCIQTYLTKLRH